MSNDYRYEVIIYWSDEDQAFIAEVPEFTRVRGRRIIVR